MITSRYDLYDFIMTQGEVLNPRGYKIKEVRDVQFQYSPFEPFDNFTARHYPIEYFKKEMQWKLTADPYNEDIKQYAKMWAQVQNPDTTFNSNYGVFWFGKQMGLWKVFMELLRDPDSRRATIPMLNDSHFNPGVNDTVCTEAVSFHIRSNMLYMSVHMRSSDIWSGLGTDCGTFAFLYRILYKMLQDFVGFSDLKVGNITITAASSHAYERNWESIKEIIKNGDKSYYEEMPWGDGRGNLELVAARGKCPVIENDLAKWLFS